MILFACSVIFEKAFLRYQFIMKTVVVFTVLCFIVQSSSLPTGVNNKANSILHDFTGDQNDSSKSQGQDLQREKRGCGELIFLTSTRNDIY